MVVSLPALAAIAGLGAVGGIVANIALTPLTSGASLLQSYWYGAGLILGERMMYTVHWEKIKKRLDKGEPFISVLEDEMHEDITAIADLSLRTMKEVGAVYTKAGETALTDLMTALLNPFYSGERTEIDSEETPTIDVGLLTVSINTIKSWTDNYLKFQHSPNVIVKYDDRTQAHIRTEYKSRFGGKIDVPLERPPAVPITVPTTNPEIIKAAVAYVGRGIEQHLKAKWCLFTKNPSTGEYFAHLCTKNKNITLSHASKAYPIHNYEKFLIGINHYYVPKVKYYNT